ncbi:Hypothetical Protein FCC1311_037772 [Hondaea fermentalgiana]|uniref:Uncharacterized protein n=1 Tax=Hondaea fermentalgiana TaxID=2315210 RepID=A0A2R5GI55_9STRA|nr:Hypothetical Protein FCC1311_037772 [Hondaea fermentalgiana]|eukprot:GBG27554.1 Hypothetical Protein FCC1311_037772 [Hondaea fermentalgiana]
MFELALRSNQQEIFVHVPGVFEVLIELANHGQVCEKRDALFRWPRAKCRQLAVRALESLSLESTSQFVKREAIRRGALVALCRAATEATPAPLILETRYERIDSENKAIVNAVLKRVDHEGLVRSLPISIKRASQAAQELLRSELNRRTSNENIKVRHRDAELYCAQIRLDKDRSVEEKLLALRLEATAKAERTRCQRNLERLLSKSGQVVLSQLAVDLAEEQPPDLEEEALAVAKLAAVDAEKAKALQEKLDRERAAREREERRIWHEVTSSLDAVIFVVEAREYSRQIFLEDVLQNGVLVTIDRLEADRAQEAQRVKDCKTMEVEDALASLVRDDEHRKLREERDCMTAEDKEGVRKAIKRMPKDLRRQFLLQEEEYLRRCENRDVLREQKKIQAELLLMGEEDATALQLRTREMYAIKFEQHKIARELQPQAQDLSISASGDFALDLRSGEDSYEYYEHGHAAASEIVHDEYAQHDDSTMRNNTSGDLYNEYFGGAYGQGGQQQEGEKYAPFEYDANESGAYANYEVAQDQSAAHQGGDADGYDEDHTKYYAGHETSYSEGQAAYDNAYTDEHYGEHQHQEITPYDNYYAEHAEHADTAEYDYNAYDQYQEGDLAQCQNYAVQQEQAEYDNAYAGEQYDHQQHQHQDFAHYDNYYAENAHAVEYDYNAYDQYQAEGQYYEVQQTEPAQDYSAYYNEDASVVAHQEMQDNYYESAAANVGYTANTTGVEYPDEQTGYYDEYTGEYVQHTAFDNGHEHGTTTQMEQEETYAANDTIDQGQWENENFDAGEVTAQGWIWDEAQQMWVESIDNQT